MAHHTVRSGYRQLVERLNRHPQGAPPSELLYRILGILFSEREAALVARLPIKPFRAETAGRAWKLPSSEARKILDTLAERAILLDIEDSGQPLYVLPPPMAGFFEFSMMRVRGDVDQKLLSELFYQYLNVEEDFIRQLFGRGQTQLGRVFVKESALPPEPSLEVLDYERASWVVRSSSRIGIGICYCRHKMEHVGRACDAPRSICMTFNNTARSLIKHGFAREVEAAECLDLLAEARGRGLVQFGENVQQRVSVHLQLLRLLLRGAAGGAPLRAAPPRPHHELHRRGRHPTLATAAASASKACPVEAVTLKPKWDPQHPKRKLAVRDEQLCLGCGVCVDACPDGHIRMAPRAERVITPVERRASRGPDGDRARHAPRPDLRQPGTPEPPGDGGRARRDPQAAAAEAGAGEPTDEIPLPGHVAQPQRTEACAPTPRSISDKIAGERSGMSILKKLLGLTQESAATSLRRQRGRYGHGPPHRG